jgi:uncharacterized membrane protein
MSIVLAAWITFNVIAWVEHWDPYPFILLNLALSFQAAYAAPVIMMSQNRQEAKDRLRAQNDYETDLKAEAHIERCHAMLEHIHANLEEVLELQRRQQALLEQSRPRTESRPSTTEEPNPTL